MEIGGQWGLYSGNSMVSLEPKTLSVAVRLGGESVSSQHKDDFSKWAWQAGPRKACTFKGRRMRAVEEGTRQGCEWQEVRPPGAILEADCHSS